MAVAYYLCLLNTLITFTISIGSLLTNSNSICNDTLNLNNNTKMYMHNLLHAISFQSSTSNTNAIYSTKLCPLNHNSKHYISIDYNLLCVYISVDKDIILKQCKSNSQAQNTIHSTSSSNFNIITNTQRRRSLLVKKTTSSPTPEPTIEPTSEPTQEPTQEPTPEPMFIVTFFPTTEPTFNPSQTYSTVANEPNDQSELDKLIAFWHQYKIWIIMGAALFFLFFLLLIYFLCSLYHCCGSKNKNGYKHKQINHKSHSASSLSNRNGRLVKRTDRRSYESIESDDENKKQTIELMSVHKPGNKRNDKNKKQNIKYKAIADDKSDHESDEKEVEIMLKETPRRKDYNDSEDSSFSANKMIEETKEIENLKVTPQFKHDIPPDITQGMAYALDKPTPDSNNNNGNQPQQVVINIVHHPAPALAPVNPVPNMHNDRNLIVPMNHVAVPNIMNNSHSNLMNPRNDINNAQSNIQNNIQAMPNVLPNLPNEIHDDDEETEAPGEGFDFQSWIMENLKECAPENDKWKEYLNNFRKHLITEDVLVALSTDKHGKHNEWKELIPAIGPRVKFQGLWEKELLRQQKKSMRM